MDQGPAPDTASWTLRSRRPAHAISHRCLEQQRAARPRGRLARLFGLDPLHPDAVGWYHGALGELRVGRILTELGTDWRVLHAVPHGDRGADIDHLVIGPPGVFALTTENRARVDGPAPVADGRTPHLPAAELEARAASRFLTRALGARIVAAPLVVLVGPAGSARGASASAVPVVAAGGLVNHLRALPARLDADLVASITRAAEEWTTWRPFGVDLPVHTDPDAAFHRLRAEVEQARGRRLVWGLALAASVVLAVAVAAAALLR